jgi:hypothetical protein
LGIKDFDYAWRLDVDATVDRPISVNFLRDMASKKKVFGYYKRAIDPAGCIMGLDAASRTFAKEKGLQFKHREVRISIRGC